MANLKVFALQPFPTGGVMDTKLHFTDAHPSLEMRLSGTCCQHGMAAEQDLAALRFKASGLKAVDIKWERMFNFYDTGSCFPTLESQIKKTSP